MESSAIRAHRGEAAGTLMVVGSVVIVGCAPRLLAIAERHAEPLTVTSLRIFPAAIVLLLALPLLGSRFPSRALWVPMALAGLLLAGFLEGLTEAVARTGPGTAIVLASTVPLFVALLARVFLHERVGLGAGCGLGVGFAGVIMVVSAQLGGNQAGAQLALGMAFALAGAIAGGGLTILLKETSIKHPDLDIVAFTAGEFLVGSVALLGLSFGIDGTAGADWSSPELWGAVAAISIAATAIGSIAFFAGLKRLSATRASAWLFLTPVVSVLIEIALGETPDTLVLVGMVLTVAGIAIVNAPPQLLARLQAAPSAAVPPAGSRSEAGEAAGGHVVSAVSAEGPQGKAEK